ncbi:hypothetical protein BMW23_0549 [Bodo saltans virus]|uniref:Uncharacterized protein n=1 Tax=Bodo saltans virus TaxID=2024608 RepID=A0A2H4UUR0_9VIRU|nr:hypothetical protein QJ851_gp0533 [Bodo saltans virus]ATZ80596.1 hypothetical protein BMW23_0549 [Bodo saltans virus]
MLNIVTSFNVIHPEIFENVLNNNCDEDLLNKVKNITLEHFYNKGNQLSTIAFQTNLKKECVKSVHNLMEKNVMEYMKIPNEIINNDKYHQHLFDEKIRMCDILEYIQNNISEGEIVLLCNGNYQIGDSEEWNNISLSQNQAYCLSSSYKYIGSKQIENNKFIFAEPDFSQYDNFVDEVRESFYTSVYHHAFLFKAPLDCIIFDEFYFFNTKCTNRILNHLLKNAINYETLNIEALDSFMLYNDEKINYQSYDKYNTNLINELNINSNITNYLIFSQ